ncbi:sugar translocase [Pseudoduganella sp. LjRoot289]|uniref:DUF7024 domain-containing protein n=1 Tax=Pseudoduganella sp. LjRoot289 TaxID=3342314 RepID=UPI003ED153DF
MPTMTAQQNKGGLADLPQDRLQGQLQGQSQGQLPLGAVARREWRWWLPGALFCVLLASVLTSGWPHGLIPDLGTPYWYTGDGLGHAWQIKRVTEGWVLSNGRSGFPFGSDFHDYPGSDAGNLLVFKLIGLFNGDWQAIYNLYFLAGFGASFASAFVVLRAASLERPYALAGAVLFAFLPFHFERIAHLFYTWYFVVPLFFHCALRMADGRLFEGKLFSQPRARLLAGAGLVAISSFGVYFALFGVLLFGTVALAGALRGDWRPAGAAALASGCVALGVLLNVAPNLAYKLDHAPNPEVSSRPIANGEIFGFKPIQLLLPRDGHRSTTLRAMHERYRDSMPLVNENNTASLGAVGAAGFLALMGVTLSAMAGRRHEARLKLLALITTVLFLFGIIGGFGSLFTILVSDWVRGWNRISVYIAFASLLGLMLMLQGWMQGRAGRRWLPPAGALCGALIVFGLWDQSGYTSRPFRAALAQEVSQDRAFIGAIEAALPAGAAVYQLPYMRFPEAEPLLKMSAYDQVKGFLHSRALRWSYAGMRGREGDTLFRTLSRLPIERQLPVLGRLGYSGVYVDRGGYADNGAAIVASLSAATGAPPALSRADGRIVFFRLPPPANAPAKLAGMSARQLLQTAYGNAAGTLNTPEVLAAGIHFAQAAWPDFVADVRGVSGPEPWGRWSDARLHPAVQIELAEPLRQPFTLVLTVAPYGPNAGQPLAVRAGAQQLSVPLQPGAQTYRLRIDPAGTPLGLIELAPPQPVTPRSQGGGNDERLIGIGLQHLSIEP